MSPFQNKTNKQTVDHPKAMPGGTSNDEFLQRVLEIQQQQLAKAAYFIQVTYCFETDFCHRFINFEINESLVAQFENQILEDFIQQAYKREKGGLLYHKVQEVPLELIEKSRKQAAKPSLTPGEKLFKDVLTDDDEEDPMFDECMIKGNNKYKAFTLCMICNPATCGYDQQFNLWKQTSARTAQDKNKKIVVNSSSY